MGRILKYVKSCSDKIYQGGGVAAPVASQVLTDVLAYLQIEKDNVQEGEEKITVVVPELREKTVKEATEILKEAGLEANFNLSDGQQIDKENTIVIEQMPLPGVKVRSNSSIEIQVRDL